MSATVLDGIRKRLASGGRKGRPLHDDGVFWPGQVMPAGVRTAATVMRHLKAAGYAQASPLRDGFWVLTAAGRAWLARDTTTAVTRRLGGARVMRPVTEIHLICRPGDPRLPERRPMVESFTTEPWPVAARRCRTGAVVAFHSDKGSDSFLQGGLTDPAASAGGVRFTVRPRDVGVPWRGGGPNPKLGFLYADTGLPAMPQLAVVVDRGLDGAGGNGAIKSLLEAEDVRWPVAGPLRGYRHTGPIDGRQNTFVALLRRLAAAASDGIIPVAFRDAGGEPWRLDPGAIGMAVAAELVAVPSDLADDAAVPFVLARPALLPAAEPEDRLAGRIRPSLSAGDFLAEVLASRQARPGQRAFRALLDAAYNRTCAISGTAVPAALEAAHIVPFAYSSELADDPSNGLLLRADLHSLWDAQQMILIPGPDGVRVALARALQGSDIYGRLHGIRLAPARVPAARPSLAALTRRLTELPLLED